MRRVSGKERLQLAREEQAAAVLAYVERPDAVGIAREHEMPGSRIPERDRPLPVEALEGGGAPLLPRVDDDFGVAAGAEAVAERFELGAQLDVVEDLAVEDDPERLVLVGERLLPAGQIDDRQPGMRQAGPVVAIGAELVRAAVPERARHVGQRLPGRAGKPVPKARRLQQCRTSGFGSPVNTNGEGRRTEHDLPPRRP